MCKELDAERNRGRVIATLLADHLDSMGAATCEIPVEVRGKKYTCRCEIARKKFMVDPDKFHTYFVGKVKFKREDYAREYAAALNDNKVIHTLIAVHDGGTCCGCADFYYSALKQEMIAVCNECGLLRELLMNDSGPGIFGPTVSFRELK